MINNKNILILTLSKVVHVIGQERWLIYKKLEEKYNARIRFIDEENDVDLRKFRGVVLLEEPIWFKKFRSPLPRLVFGKNRSNIILCTIVSDFQIQIAALKKFHKLFEYQIQFHNHESGISYLRKHFPTVNLQHIPMHVSEKCFYKEKIVKDVCILDTVQGHTLTPLRNRISNICRMEFKNETTILEHPGKRVGYSSHGEYSDLLKRSIFTIACTTVYGISVRKYYEAGCAASSIIGDCNGFREHDMVRENLVYVSPTSSDEEIFLTISNALSSKNLIERNAIKNYSKYIEHYSSNIVVSHIYSGIDQYEFQRNYNERLSNLLKVDPLSTRIFRRSRNIKEKLKMGIKGDSHGL